MRSSDDCGDDFDDLVIDAVPKPVSSYHQYCALHEQNFLPVVFSLIYHTVISFQKNVPLPYPAAMLYESVRAHQ